MIEEGLITHLQDDPAVSALNGDRVYLGAGREDDETSIAITLVGLNPKRSTSGSVSMFESTYTFDVRASSKLDAGILAKAVADSVDNLSGEIGGETFDRVLLDGVGDGYTEDTKTFRRTLTFKIFHY